MTLTEWIACVVAGVAVLALARLWWSTRGAAMRQLNALIAKGEESLKRAYAEIDDHRAAALKLREANNKLRQALAIREKEAGDREHEIRQLKKANNALSAANDKLNEILGDQEQVNQKLSLDVAMLKDQVGKLRAQQGLEP